MRQFDFYFLKLGLNSVQEEAQSSPAFLSSNSSSLYLWGHGNGLSNRCRIGLISPFIKLRNYRRKHIICCAFRDFLFSLLFHVSIKNGRLHFSNYDCRQFLTHFTHTQHKNCIFSWVVYDFCSVKKRKKPQWLRFLLTSTK